MSWKRLGLIGLMFLTGFASIAQAWQDPTHLMFDWLAIATGLSFAGLANPKLDNASNVVQLVTSVCAGIAAYALAEVGLGWRFQLHLDFRAIYPALIAIPLIHANNPSVVQPIAQAVGLASKDSK
jgi:hypothetical protein